MEHLKGTERAPKGPTESPQDACDARIWEEQQEMGEVASDTFYFGPSKAQERWKEYATTSNDGTENPASYVILSKPMMGYGPTIHLSLQRPHKNQWKKLTLKCGAIYSGRFNRRAHTFKWIVLYQCNMCDATVSR